MEHRSLAMNKVFAILGLLGVCIWPGPVGAVERYNSTYRWPQTRPQRDTSLERTQRREVRLLPMPRRGPINHSASRYLTLRPYQDQAPKRGGGRSFIDPLQGRRNAWAEGRHPSTSGPRF